RSQALPFQRRPHPRHRALDDVGAAALDRRVYRCALCSLALMLYLGFDAWEMRLAPEQGGREQILARLLQRLADIGADSGEAIEIAVDDRLRLVRGDSKPSGQPPARDAVEDGEIDRLGRSAGVAVHFAEQFARGHVVDVGAR